jgi:flagellar transcriptional activator FlhC
MAAAASAITQDDSGTHAHGNLVPKRPRRGLVDQAKDVFHAVSLIEMGARMQVLEHEIALSRDRLIRLYREVRGESPPKGMLPFSADWFMVWRHNIHASLFYNIYLFLRRDARCEHLVSLAKGFRLYLEHCEQGDEFPVLDITRAWTLIRFFEGGMLQLTPCSKCGGRFVAHRHDPQEGIVCVACRPPSRAGKTRRALSA